MSNSIVPFLRKNAYLYSTREELIQACMKHSGSPRKNVQNALYDIGKSKTPISIGSKEPTKTLPSVISASTLKGLSESDIRKKHDIRYIISQIIANLEKGTFVPDQDFVKQCNIRQHIGYRQVMDDPEFRQYKGRAGGITYWSHPDSILKFKDEGILT